MTAARPTRLAVLALSAALTTLGLACDSGPPLRGDVPVYPVKGQVFFKGKPLAHALLVFETTRAPAPAPAQGKAAEPPRPVGRADKDGNFEVHTYLYYDGLPAGAYRVGVSVSPPSTAERGILGKVDKDMVKPSVASIPHRFSDPAQSGLTATIQAGENPPLVFDLK